MDDLKAGKRLSYFDSYRGVAASMVFLSHFLVSYSLNTKVDFIYYSPIHLFFDGFAAVSVFFVLSGFVLTRRYFQTEDEILFFPFVVNRVFRIFGPFVVALLIYWSFYLTNILATTVFPRQSDWMRPFNSGPSNLADLLSQMVFRGSEAGHVFLMPHAWTLSVELFFSCMIPVIVVAMKKNWKNSLYVLGLFFVFAVESSLIVYGAMFLAGAVISYHSEYLARTIRRLAKSVKLLLLCLGILLLCVRFTVFEALHIPLQNFELLIWSLNGLGAAIMLALGIGVDKIQKLMNHRALLFLGRISYSFYLLHFFVITFIAPFLVNYLYFLIPRGTICELVAGVFLFLITCGMAQLMYRFVERPFIALGKSLSSLVGKLSDR